MKFKVKVLMLLVSMLFSALGASAQIAEGQYKIKAQGEVYIFLDDPDEFYYTMDSDNATVFDLKKSGNQYYLMIGDDYMNIGYLDNPEKSSDSRLWTLTGDVNNVVVSSDWFGWDYLVYKGSFVAMDNTPYYWQLVPVGGSEPTKTYTYTIVYDSEVPDGTTITVGGITPDSNDQVEITTELNDGNLESNINVVGLPANYRVYHTLVGKKILIRFVQTYTYTVEISSNPRPVESVMVKDVLCTISIGRGSVVLEQQISDEDENYGVVAPNFEGYTYSVRKEGANLIVEYTRVYTYTVKFAEGSPSDAYITVEGVSGKFGNNATFTRDTKISNFNTEITPKSYSGRTSQVIGTKIDDYNYIATVTYYQASLTSGKYYRFATSEYMLKAAPDQSYENEKLSNLVVSVDDKSDMNNIWQAVQVGEGNLMYLRHANSEQYLSKKQNDGTYTLVATTEQAGKFSKEGDSMREGDNYLTIADGNLTTSNEPSAIWSRTAEVDVVTLTLNDYGYATTCMPFNFTVSEGAEIYGTIDVHDYSDYTTLKVHQVEGVAQAGQGYIIKGEPRAEGEPQKTVTLTPTTEEADDEAESSMLGTLIRQTGVYAALGYKYYGFKGDEFVLASSDAIPANKAVYITASPSSVMRMSLGFDEGLTTDILGLTPSASTQQPIYDLQGRSCKSHSLQGLYLQGGRKMIRR